MSGSDNKKAPDANKGVDYKDRVYTCQCPHGQYRTAVVFSWVCVILSLLSQIVCGCINAVLDSSILYTCIHFALCFLSYGALISMLIKFTRGGKKILCSIYDSVMTGIPFRTLIAILISIGGIVFEALSAFVFDNGHNVWATILCLVLHLFAIFAVFVARLSITGLPFKTPNDN